MLGFVLAALLASAELDAPHAAVLDVISRGDDASGCSAAEKQRLAATASIRPLGKLGADRVVLAQVFGSCICGAQNCPYYAIRLTPGKPRVLLTAIGIGERDADHAKPLPGLVVTAHDSAMVAEEVTYAYRNGEYAVARSGRVRMSDRARKPDDTPIRFAPGASSAELHGTVSTGWYDVFTFDAAKGQRVLISEVRSSAKMSFVLYGPNNMPLPDVRAGVPFTLPAGGSYRLTIDNDSENDVPYRLRFAIRSSGRYTAS